MLQCSETAMSRQRAPNPDGRMSTSPATEKMQLEVFSTVTVPRHNLKGGLFIVQFSSMSMAQKEKMHKTTMFFYPRGDNLIAVSTNVENTQIHIIIFSLQLQKDDIVEIV